MYFGQLRSRDGSVVHGGDEREGDEKGDDEKIHIDLVSVSAITHVAPCPDEGMR